MNLINCPTRTMKCSISLCIILRSKKISDWYHITYELRIHQLSRFIIDIRSSINCGIINYQHQRTISKKLFTLFLYSLSYIILHDECEEHVGSLMNVLWIRRWHQVFVCLSIYVTASSASRSRVVWFFLFQLVWLISTLQQT